MNEDYSEADVMAEAYRTGTSSYSPVPDNVKRFLVDCHNAGYKPWLSGRAGKLSEPLLLQKCIEKANNKLYYINIKVWDFGREFSSAIDSAVSLCPNVQFRVGERYAPLERTFDVKYHITDGDTLVTVEKFFHDMYNKLGCTPYKHNTDD